MLPKQVYVGPSWGYVGPFGVYVEAMFAHPGGYVATSWPPVGPCCGRCWTVRYPPSWFWAMLFSWLHPRHPLHFCNTISLEKLNYAQDRHTPDERLKALACEVPGNASRGSEEGSAVWSPLGKARFASATVQPDLILPPQTLFLKVLGVISPPPPTATPENHNFEGFGQKLASLALTLPRPLQRIHILNHALLRAICFQEHSRTNDFLQQVQTRNSQAIWNGSLRSSETTPEPTPTQHLRTYLKSPPPPSCTCTDTWHNTRLDLSPQNIPNRIGASR